MNTFKNLLKSVCIIGAIGALVCGNSFAGDTKFATSSSAAAAAVTSGPQPGKIVVKSISTSCDVALGLVKFYTRAGKYAPSIVPTNGQTVIALSNPSLALTNGDRVVYAHANGTLDTTTLSAATTSNVTLSAGISSAGVAGDFLYDMQLSGKIVAADNSAAVGTNKLLNMAGEVFVTPGDSPLYVTLDSATNSVLQVTADVQ